jgi:hypothetical protein
MSSSGQATRVTLTGRKKKKRKESLKAKRFILNLTLYMNYLLELIAAQIPFPHRNLHRLVKVAIGW